MTDATIEQIATLVELQRIMTENGKLEMQLKQVPARISELEERLDAFTLGFEKNKEVIDELNKEYRVCESDVQLNLGKIQKSNEKLRSVKTNKEYQSSLKEIEDLEEINSKIEDKMLELLEQIEKTEEDLSGQQRQYSAIAEETKREKASIKEAEAQCRKKITELESQRNAVVERLGERLLDLFSRQRGKQNDGVAIVEVINGVCQGCNMNIPPQMYNELQRRNSLKNCPSCERLIYWENHDERSE
jgi:predicted  nucleic acid-binding Zn-ribbon protein